MAALALFKTDLIMKHITLIIFISCFLSACSTPNQVQKIADKNSVIAVNNQTGRYHNLYQGKMFTQPPASKTATRHIRT